MVVFLGKTTQITVIMGYKQKKFSGFGNSPLKQNGKIDVPFSIAGRKFPAIVSTERDRFVYSSDIDEYKGLRKDHPISIEKKRQQDLTRQKKIMNYKKESLKLNK
jgi:hypothetical protein